MGEKETLSTERASNLNLSKSNREMAAGAGGDAEGIAVEDPGVPNNRLASGGRGDAKSERATNLNTSRSNVDEDAGVQGERAINLNSSKSNFEAGDDAAAAINNTKSNIKNG